MTITVLLVDDHVVVRQGLQMLLAARADMTVVGEAGDGAEAVRLAQALKPDIILMDVVMPGMDGIATIRALRQHGIRSAVLMLTSVVQPQPIQDAIRAGASGYVLKTTRATELVEAIRRAAAGQRTLDPLAADALMDGFAHQSTLEDLTPREREVLQAMARGWTNGQIAAAFLISEATVRSHVANVSTKLQLRNRAHATVFALKQGLITLDEVED